MPWDQLGSILLIHHHSIMHYLFLVLLLGALPCYAQTTSPASSYGDSVEYFLGIHNEHADKDSITIEFITQHNTVILIHKGPWSHWGMQWQAQRIQTGPYVLRLTWKETDGIKRVERPILLRANIQYFTLNIELANDPRQDRLFNAIYLDQYEPHLESVVFERKWDPQKQFKKKRRLLPDYTVTNQNDSTLYGAYTRFSSALNINWVQPHDIAFMRFERKEQRSWFPIINGPRIQMELKKEEVGNTLTDMDLGCRKKEFKKGNTYRISIEYMFYDLFAEDVEATGPFEDYTIIEQTIYTYFDEFTLE